MHRVVLASIALLAAQAAHAGTPPPIDGTFLSRFSNCGAQGDTYALGTFVLGRQNTLTLYVTFYDAPDSAIAFASVVYQYTGTYKPANQSFSLPNFTVLGEPNGFNALPFTGHVKGNKLFVQPEGCPAFTGKRL